MFQNVKRFARPAVAAVALGSAGVASVVISVEVTTMFTDLGTDVGTALGLGYVLMTLSFGGIWLMGFIRKAGNSAK